MNTTNDRAMSIFQSANAYSKAAKWLNSGCQKDMSLLLPSQVNAALSLELYFKSLYYLENGKDFKIGNKHSHDFHQLYKALSNTVQRELESEFQQILQSRNMQDVLQMEAVAQAPISRDFAEHLQAWSDVFVKARYIYDYIGDVKSMMFFPEIEQVLLHSILKLRTDWLP